MGCQFLGCSVFPTGNHRFHHLRHPEATGIAAVTSYRPQNTGLHLLSRFCPKKPDFAAEVVGFPNVDSAGIWRLYKGACLFCRPQQGDLQKSAMAVLRLYMKTAVFEELKAAAKK